MNKVFMKVKDRTYEMELGPVRYEFAWDNKGYKKLALFTIQQTQFPNIIWMRIISFSLHWPFIRHIACFTESGG